MTRKTAILVLQKIKPDTRTAFWLIIHPMHICCMCVRACARACLLAENYICDFKLSFIILCTIYAVTPKINLLMKRVSYKHVVIFCNP